MGVEWLIIWEKAMLAPRKAQKGRGCGNSPARILNNTKHRLELHAHCAVQGRSVGIVATWDFQISEFNPSHVFEVVA